MLIEFKKIEKAQENQKEYKAGIYDVRVTKYGEGKSKQTGTPYIDITFETMKDEIFSVKKRFFITEKALNMYLNFLGAIGLYDKSRKDDLDVKEDEVLGSMLQVEFVKGEANEQGKSYLELKPYSCQTVSGATTTKKAKAEDEIDEDSIPF